MTRAALLLFHNEWEIVRSRVSNLRNFNPQLAVYGLYGGEDADFPDARAAIEDDLDGLWPIVGRSPRWKWQNTDLSVREWFTSIGQHVDFDVLHVIQWDLLLFASVDALYRHVPPSSLAITGIVTDVISIDPPWP